MTYRLIEELPNGARFEVAAGYLQAFKAKLRDLHLHILSSAPVPGGYAITVGP
jgi:hypothetical protein